MWKRHFSVTSNSRLFFSTLFWPLDLSMICSAMLITFASLFPALFIVMLWCFLLKEVKAAGGKGSQLINFASSLPVCVDFSSTGQALILMAVMQNRKAEKRAQAVEIRTEQTRAGPGFWWLSKRHGLVYENTASVRGVLCDKLLSLFFLNEGAFVSSFQKFPWPQQGQTLCSRRKARLTLGSAGGREKLVINCLSGIIMSNSESTVCLLDKSLWQPLLWAVRDVTIATCS